MVTKESNNICMRNYTGNLVFQNAEDKVKYFISE